MTWAWLPPDFHTVGCIRFQLNGKCEVACFISGYILSTSQIGSLLPLSGSVIRPKLYGGFSLLVLLVQSFVGGVVWRWWWAAGWGGEAIGIAWMSLVVCAGFSIVVGS